MMRSSFLCKLNLVIICWCLVGGFAQPAMAYGTIGHRVVAEIAERNLTPKARALLKTLIGGEGLAYWANWPDFIKSDTTGFWKPADQWHYINLTGNQAKENFTDSLKAQPVPNLYTQIPAMMQQLGNGKLPLQERRQALYFLLHLVGDLMQPLHVGRPEDLGANRIQVMWFSKRTNLHAVWDTDLVDHQQYSFTEFATVLNSAPASKKAAFQKGTLEDWFWESHTLANDIYARVPADGNLGYKYNYMYKQLLEDQLLKGGLRLARLLNEVLR